MPIGRTLHWIAQREETLIKPEHVVAVLAILLRLALVWRFLPEPAETENMRAGFVLASRGYLGDPFVVPTGPTAHVAPMYPTLIAACVRAFGDPRLGFDIARSILAVGFGVFIALLPRVAGRLGLGRAAGLAASLLFLPPGIPVFAWTEASGQHEALLTMLWLFGLTPMTLAAIEHEVPTVRRTALLGVAWGVGAYSSPLLVPAVVLLGLAVATWSPPERRRSLRRPLLVLVAALGVTLTPWTIRNMRVVGELTLVRDNFGLELAVSNADDATPDMRENMLDSRSMTRHPYFDSTEARRMALLGERAYYAQRGDEARLWIRTHPREFAALTLHRIRLFFFPRLGMEHHAPFYLFSMVLGTVGAVRLFRRRRMAGAGLVAVVVGYALPHFLIQGHARYSYPILWIPTLLACWTTLDVLRSWRLSRSVR